LRTTFDASSDGKNFFIFFSRNPLKSPDSTKENQGNPSLFCLVLFGFVWFYLQRVRALVEPVGRAWTLAGRLHGGRMGHLVSPRAGGPAGGGRNRPEES
jgi:hypothetical protein